MYVYTIHIPPLYCTWYGVVIFDSATAHSLLCWLVLPRAGPQVSLKGDVSTSWNGESSTLFSVEAPYQLDIERFTVAVNASFVYCAVVRRGGGGVYSLPCMAAAV